MNRMRKFSSRASNFKHNKCGSSEESGLMQKPSNYYLSFYIRNFGRISKHRSSLYQVKDCCNVVNAQFREEFRGISEAKYSQPWKKDLLPLGFAKSR